MKVGPDHPIPRELRAARAYAGTSRKRISSAVGISDVTLGAWERGDFTRPPAQPMLSAIAKFCRLPERFELVTETPSKPSLAERATRAAQRLDGTPDTSSKTDGVQGAGGGGK